MNQSAFVFAAELWRYSGPAAWYFLTLPREVADQIRPQVVRVGFGSVRVRVCIGETSWKTSIFPDKASGSYVLPVKAEVRRAEGLDAGTQVMVCLEL